MSASNQLSASRYSLFHLTLKYISEVYYTNLVHHAPLHTIFMYPPMKNVWLKYGSTFGGVKSDMEYDRGDFRGIFSAFSGFGYLYLYFSVKLSFLQGKTQVVIHAFTGLAVELNGVPGRNTLNTDLASLSFTPSTMSFSSGGMIWNLYGSKMLWCVGTLFSIVLRFFSASQIPLSTRDNKSLRASLFKPSLYTN